MKKLDLNAYGVVEMSNAEMRETDGGGLFYLIFGLGMLYYLLNEVL
jgi:hypothetical protein